MTPSGGTNPYTYLWDDPAAQTTPTATGLAAGTYNCTITDNGAKSWNLNYNEDFNAAIGAEWDDNSTYVFRGETISGRFANNDDVTLNLSALPAHDSIRIVCDLYIFDSWDGNNTSNGPDFWTISTDNDTIIHTTFSNHDLLNPFGALSQSYPGDYPQNNPGKSSSVAGNLPPVNMNNFSSSKYLVNKSGIHSSNSVSINFSGFGLQGLGDESWGIDNIKVYLFGV